MNKSIAQEFTPLARKTDPQTSIDAGRKAEKFRTTHARCIEQALKNCGPMIPPEIAAECRLSVVQIDRRRKEMVTAGVIKLGLVRGGYQTWELLA